MDNFLDSIIEGAIRIKALGEIRDQNFKNHIHHIDDMLWQLIDAIEEQARENTKTTEPALS
jgi:hypothetical protein